MKHPIENDHAPRLSTLAERLTKNNFDVRIDDPCESGVRM